MWLRFVEIAQRGPGGEEMRSPESGLRVAGIISAILDGNGLCELQARMPLKDSARRAMYTSGVAADSRLSVLHGSGPRKRRACRTKIA